MPALLPVSRKLLFQLQYLLTSSFFVVFPPTNVSRLTKNSRNVPKKGEEEAAKDNKR